MCVSLSVHWCSCRLLRVGWVSAWGQSCPFAGCQQAGARQELPRYPGTSVTSSKFCFLICIFFCSMPAAPFWLPERPSVWIKFAVWFRKRSEQRVSVALGGEPRNVCYWWLSQGVTLNVLPCTRGGCATAPLWRSTRLGCVCKKSTASKKITPPPAKYEEVKPGFAELGGVGSRLASAWLKVHLKCPYEHGIWLCPGVVLHQPALVCSCLASTIQK